MGYFDPHSYEDMEAQAGGVARLGAAELGLEPRLSDAGSYT